MDDESRSSLASCTLLANPRSYVPDVVDLNTDHVAREYWLKCFESAGDKFAERAAKSQPCSETAPARAEQMKRKYVGRVRRLKLHPEAFGKLTVRSLLDSMEDCLKEFGFPDPYLNQKEQENEYALGQLESRLVMLDGLEERARSRELVVGVAAGNMFDWGAKQVVELMEAGGFGFQQAIDRIPDRPWLVDCLDEWVTRLEGPPHRCAAIFLDNSGPDCILGVIPFARDLLIRGTKVILCANSGPALNDVTHPELVVLLERISGVCPVVADALSQRRLLAMQNGQLGVCLDLSRVDGRLAKVLEDVDFLVLVGMGRAIHTNLNAAFTCESLKIAVIKNKWMCEQMGGPMFSVVCKYERPTSSHCEPL